MNSLTSDVMLEIAKAINDDSKILILRLINSEYSWFRPPHINWQSVSFNSCKKLSEFCLNLVRIKSETIILAIFASPHHNYLVFLKKSRIEHVNTEPCLWFSFSRIQLRLLNPTK